ncbi:hypothetical protein OVN20_05310 [Microcella daejeonensis]|uniref:hypothetical protein n=1 Tax=Microcella daejeonensis TaxID=2994971 RepID=UPI00226F231A|nr:hypothetical protein [Microcella daejeonensis]WAB84970.1 hypothetical protein OVN20_05310 [Microcella daejeonensis]
MKKSMSFTNYSALSMDDKILAVDPGSRMETELDEAGRPTHLLIASGQVLACDIPALRTLAREAGLVFRGQPQHAAIR